MRTYFNHQLKKCLIILSGIIFPWLFASSENGAIFPEIIINKGKVSDILNAGNELWVIVDGVLIKYDKSIKELIRYDQEKEGLPKYLTVLAKDNENKIWVISPEAVATFDGTSCQIIASGSNGYGYSGIFIDNLGNKWIGNGIYLNKYDGVKWESWIWGSLLSSGLDRVNSIFISKDNNVWYGAESSITRSRTFGSLIDGLIAPFPILDRGVVYSVKEDKQNNIWIGTKYQGLVKFNRTNFTFYDNITSSLINNTVNDIKFDDSGNLWLANGPYLVKFDGNKFQTCTDTLFASGITKIELDSSKNIWIGTNKDGLIKYSEESCDWITTGIMTNYSLSPVNVYPNPFHDKINISLPGSKGMNRVRIVDVTGKTIVDKKLKGDLIEFDLSFCHSGIYNFIIDNNAGIRTCKLMKK